MTQQTQLAALGLFDTSVPRYTSYPTAAQFTPAIGPDQYGKWLSAVPAGAEISLYVHVPFCRRLCWFCACRTQGTSTLAPVIAYVETLLQELVLVRAQMPAGVTLSRLHWGGGTPTLLPADQIARLSLAILAAFPLAPNAEFSIEIDPVEIDDARLHALADAGMNRVSLGVQDLDPAIQTAIGRAQSHALTQSVARSVRDIGIRGLNVDLLYGLPHQTETSIRDTVEKVLLMQPDRIALYGYAHVPWTSRRQQLIPDTTLPSPQARLGLFETAAAQFTAAGYVQVGIDHFALPHDGLARARASGTLRRNFQGYTDDHSPILVGLGASAISRLPQGFAQNAAATAVYNQSVRAGQFAAHRGYRFGGEDKLRARMIEMLMCDLSLDIAALANDFPDHAFAVGPICDVIEDRFGAFMHWQGEKLVIKSEGWPLARLVARMCDANAAAPARYSAAI